MTTPVTPPPPLRPVYELGLRALERCREGDIKGAKSFYQAALEEEKREKSGVFLLARGEEDR